MPFDPVPFPPLAPLAEPANAAMAGIERKVQQLTKVIHHLNAKGDDGDVADKASGYENEIEGILRDASERVRRFQAACSHSSDKKLIEQKVREVEAKYEGHRQRALAEFDEYKRRTSASHAALKQDADARIGAMARELLAAKEEFAARVREFEAVTEGMEKKARESGKSEKKKAAAELAELVKKHNAKYNDMLQQ